MNAKYTEAFELGRKMMQKFPSFSPEFKKGMAIMEWAYARRTWLDEVQLFPVAEVGSLEEKINHDVESRS